MDADVIVIGGGLAGLTLCALLATYDIRAICVDRDDPSRAQASDYDIRTTAISYGCQRVLKAAGAWDEAALQPCPIKDIQILDDGSPVLLEFLIDDVEGDAFGWIVDNAALRRTLFARVATLEQAQHIAPVAVRDFAVHDTHAEIILDDRTLRAPLVIGADGKHSFTRQWMKIPVRAWNYNQQAIVCAIEHTRPHGHKAIEHFMTEGPFAILPMNDTDEGRHRSALVWSEHNGRKSKMDWDDATFITALNARLPAFYGEVARIGKRAAYPLTFTHAYRYIAPRMALIADAAHAIHPIAGQGLNLGLRDIAVLAELLVDAKHAGADMGSASLLESYQRQRRFDNVLMAAATDNLNRLFSNKSRLLGAARKLGLQAIQRLPATRRFFMRQAMGAPARHVPRLIRDGSL